MDYDSIRRGLAEAMGYTHILDGSDGPTGRLSIAGGLREARRPLPDPLNDAEDAEALEAWLVGQGWHVKVYSGRSFARAWAWRRKPGRPITGQESWEGEENAGGSVYATDEPNPAIRRRRALVEAAWQALRATREVR